MKKIYFCLFSLFFLFKLSSQSSISFTIISNGGYSITCANPTLNLLCITNYTAGFVTYTLAGPSGTNIGNNFPVNLPGNYTLTAFANSLVNSTQTLAIGINTQAPVSTISPTTQNITCSFTSATTISATANPSTNAIHYFITPSSNSFAVIGTTATYVPGMVGTHTHVLQDQNNGCKLSKIFLVNSASGIPTASVSSPQSFTIGCGSNSLCSVGISGAGSAFGNPISYTIMNSGSTPSYVTNSQNLYSFSVSGTYTAIVHDNVTNCEARVMFSIVTKTISPNLSLFVNTQTLTCDNSQTTIYGISTSPNTSYLWSVPGSSISPTGFSVSTSVLSSSPNNSVIGTFTFLVTDNSNACSTESTLTMYQNIYVPIASIFNPGSPSVTCSSPSVVLQNQSSTGIPPSTFPNTLPILVLNWNGPSTPTGTLNTYTVFSIGVYSLNIKDPNNGCTSGTTYTLGDARTYPVVNSPAGPPPYCLDPPTVSVDISPILGGAVGNYSYTWSSPASATVSGQNTATLTTNAVGTYTINVTHTVSGCVSTGTLQVTVCTGIEQFQEESDIFQLYPNPAKDLLKIVTSKSTINGLLELYDSNGHHLWSQKISEKVSNVDMSNYAKGLYIIVLKSEENSTWHKKLILE